MYRISNTHNMLVVLGCNTVAYTASERTEGGSYSYTYFTGSRRGRPLRRRRLLPR
jgi:hypothetical protein